MKTFILILAIFVSAGCVSQASSVNVANNTTQPTPTVEASNVNAIAQYSYPNYQYDKDTLERLNVENERFRQPPDEFKSVDFKNFKYDFGRLKNGELERNQSKDPLEGSFQFSFNDVFYLDLIGDGKKEAVVFLYSVSCGGSCDGGADIVYFYSSDKGKAKLIDIFETGSNSSRCGLKTLTVKDKKIRVEQFGRCLEHQTYDTSGTFVCKFCAKDETHTVYTIDKNGLKRQSAEIVETKGVNVMDSPAFVSINE